MLLLANKSTRDLWRIFEVIVNCNTPAQFNVCTETDIEFIEHWSDKILDPLDARHTKSTIVVNCIVRGASRGECKLVSLAKVSSATPAIIMWDNPLTGLNSLSSLAFVRLFKVISQVTGMLNIVTAYQIFRSIMRSALLTLYLFFTKAPDWFGSC